MKEEETNIRKLLSDENKKNIFSDHKNHKKLHQNMKLMKSIQPKQKVCIKEL